MWVRSQDKTRLTNVEDFRILEQSNGNHNIWGNNNCNLGSYSTEEKALKVLDMIQKFIKGQKESFYAYKDNKEIVNHYYYPNKEQLVFQMPQDSEVE